MITIIIPTYNSEKTIRYCLDSVLNQTYKDYECLIIDSSESLDTFEIVNHYIKTDSRFVFVRCKSKGAMSQRAYGIKIAKGDYIGFVDSDDIIPEHYFSILLKACYENKADFACCSLERKNLKDVTQDDLNKIINENDFRVFEKANKKKQYNYRNTIKSISLCTKLFKSGLAKNACKYYNYTNQVSLWEDSIFTYYCFLYAEKIALINKQLYIAINNDKSVTRTSKYDYSYLENTIKVTKVLFKINEDRKDRSYIKKQHSIYALFGSINYLITIWRDNKMIMKREFFEVRHLLKKELSLKNIKIYHKEFSKSETLLSFSLKYNMFVIAKTVLKRINRVSSKNSQNYNN